VIRKLWWRLCAALFPLKSLPHPSYDAPGAAPRVPETAGQPGSGSGGVGVGADAQKRLAECVLDPGTLRGVLAVMDRLPSEPHLDSGIRSLRQALEQGGQGRGYADICTVLYGASGLLTPATYLEVGVRRGRSAAMVAGRSPACDIWGFDEWQSNYADAQNPGPEFVRKVLSDVGHKGKLHLVSGDSHETLRSFFSDNPDRRFDLITVDGDHSRWGAARDLSDVLPHLKIGGVIVFDDICHPSHTYLLDVWRELAAKGDRFGTWEYDKAGYGVAFGVRRY